MPGSCTVSQRWPLPALIADEQAMDHSATKAARTEALSRAKTHNLDVAAIARETVRLTLEEAFAVSHLGNIPQVHKLIRFRLSQRCHANNPILPCLPLA
jgi:hypothetical protein